MECKDTKRNRNSFKQRIRLVPYWNVKEDRQVLRVLAGGIRLVPYWNVKQKQEEQKKDDLTD